MDEYDRMVEDARHAWQFYDEEDRETFEDFEDFLSWFMSE